MNRKPLNQWTFDDLLRYAVEDREAYGMFKGKICVTGKFSTGRKTLSRSELAQHLKNMCWEYSDKITKETKALLCEDINSNSSLMQKAKKWGVPIIPISPPELMSGGDYRYVQSQPDLYLGNLLRSVKYNHSKK
jgi:hypothetical protein